VPDLTLEVISESSWRRDRIEKKALYEQYGVKEYWLVDPDSRTIEVFALVKGAFRLHSKATASQTAKSKLLPGFAVAWSQISP
jgi:Uma2 family endonuclease